MRRVEDREEGEIFTGATNTTKLNEDPQSRGVY